MLFSLEALKAEHGDCLLLHWGTASAPRRLLIDGGPPGVYQAALRRRLMQLRERGPVGRSGRLALDAVVVSHAHPDHIVGVLELCRELRRDREQRRNARFRVKRLWHNSWAELVGTDLAAEDLAALADEASPTVAAVLRSVERSNELAAAARVIGLTTNRAFGGGVIQAGDAAKLARGLSVTVIGPNAEQIAALTPTGTSRSTSSGGSPPTTTSCPATAGTATRRPRRCACSPRRAALRRTRCTSPTETASTSSVSGYAPGRPTREPPAAGQDGVREPRYAVAAGGTRGRARLRGRRPPRLEIGIRQTRRLLVTPTQPGARRTRFRRA